MKSQALKQAWKIWILPLIILQAYTTITVTFFLALKDYIQYDENAVYLAEKMITFTMGGPIFAVLYYIMDKYEKVKQLKTRKITKRGL